MADPITLGVIGLGVVGAGLSVAGGIAAQERSKKQARAIKKEAEIKMRERGRAAKKLAGHQRASFLASGISLTGEGTAQATTGETYDFGIQDIGLMRENAETRRKNVLSQGRTQFISGLAQGALSLATTFALPGIGEAFSGATAAGEAGKGFTSAFDVAKGTAGFGF
jgi:hypothetical protein